MLNTINQIRVLHCTDLGISGKLLKKRLANLTLAEEMSQAFMSGGVGDKFPVCSAYEYSEDMELNIDHSEMFKQYARRDYLFSRSKGYHNIANLDVVNVYLNLLHFTLINMECPKLYNHIQNKLRSSMNLDAFILNFDYRFKCDGVDYNDLSHYDKFVVLSKIDLILKAITLHIWDLEGEAWNVECYLDTNIPEIIKFAEEVFSKVILHEA